MPSAFDLIRSIAVVFGIGYCARQERKFWIFGDSVLWGCYGAGLFLFPGFLFPGTTTPMLLYIVRIFASQIIGMESMRYFSRHSRDNSVIGATLWTRVISSLMLLLVLTNSYSQTQHKFPEKVLYFDMLAYAMLLLTSVYQFWRGEYCVGGREQKGTLSTILRVIFLIFLFFGLVHMSYPTWLLPVQQTAMEILMVRCVGAMLLGLAFTAMYAPAFKYEEDSISVLVSFIVTFIMMFISLSYAHFMGGLFNSRQALVIYIGYIPVIMLGVYLLWRKQTWTTKAQ